MMHISAYAVIAIAGILAALWLSLRTATPAGVPPESLWDAGVFAVAAAFVVSRVLGFLLLLVIEHGEPTLSFHDVLSFSSINDLSLLVTSIPVMLWLRWKRLPFLRVADAWAPCSVLLWGALELADASSGMGNGLPTRLPWGIHAAGDSTGLRVHPVAIYTAMAALILCVLLVHRIRQVHLPGHIAGLALVASGMISFVLDMLRLPEQPLGHEWLDLSQWIALAGIGLGACLLTLPSQREVH